MIGESIEHAQQSRSLIDKAIGDMARGRVSFAAPELADAAERLCKALAELAWAECNRAVRDTGEED